MDIEEEAKQFVEGLKNKTIEPDGEKAKNLGVALRNKRRFRQLLEFTNACIGAGVKNPALVRLYAHAMIELDHLAKTSRLSPARMMQASRPANSDYLAKAMSVLAALVRSMADNHPEYSQAVGMLGRVHKQIFLYNQAYADQHFARAALRNAVKHYQEGLRVSKGQEDFIWHAVNVAALASRAEKASIPLPDPIDWKNLAREVEAEVTRRQDVDKVISAWDCANAGEACLAHGDPEKAIDWFAKYVQHSKPEAYALHSTLRQLHSLWGIKPDRTKIGEVIAMLHVRLALIEKGQISCDGVNLAGLAEMTEENRPALERIIGDGKFAVVSSMLRNLSLGAAVGRVGTSEHSGTGTGFLVDGGTFNDRWRGRRLLLTNAHVVTDDRAVRNEHGALSPSESVVIFTNSSSPARTYKVSNVLWSSPPANLDASLVTLDPEPPPEIGHCEIAADMPPYKRDDDPKPFVYVIGHPNGGPLSISLHDNELIDDERLGLPEPPEFVRIHYRTPTERGSSGSPVFYGESWRVIGLHRAYHASFMPFTGDGEPYEANEAIWIQSIVNAARKA